MAFFFLSCVDHVLFHWVILSIALIHCLRICLFLRKERQSFSINTLWIITNIIKRNKIIIFFVLSKLFYFRTFFMRKRKQYSWWRYRSKVDEKVIDISERMSFYVWNIFLYGDMHSYVLWCKVICGHRLDIIDSQSVNVLRPTPW